MSKLSRKASQEINIKSNFCSRQTILFKEKKLRIWKMSSSFLWLLFCPLFPLLLRISSLSSSGEIERDISFCERLKEMGVTFSDCWKVLKALAQKYSGSLEDDEWRVVNGSQCQKNSRLGTTSIWIVVTSFGNEVPEGLKRRNRGRLTFSSALLC